MPKGIPNKVDTGDMSQPSEIIGVTAQSIIVAESPITGDHAKQLAFMEENVEVMIQESSNPNDENPVYAGCNGEIVAIFRGRPAVLKRKFIESLLGKLSMVDTPEFTNTRGERDYKIRQRQGQRYNIQVINDKNPRGVDWLRSRISSAN